MDNNKTIIYCYGFASKYHWLLSLKHSFLNSDFANFFAHTCACLSVYFQLFVSECPIVRPCVSSFFCFLSATSFFSPGFHFLVSSLVCPSSFYLFVCFSFRQFVCSYICFLFFFNHSSVFPSELSFIRPYVRSLTLFVLTSVCSFIDFVRAYVCAAFTNFVRASVRSFVRSSVRALLRLCARSCICLFIHSSVRAFVPFDVYFHKFWRPFVCCVLVEFFVHCSFLRPVLHCVFVSSFSVHLSACASVRLFVFRPCVRSFFCAFTRPSTRPSARPSARSSARHLTVRPLVHLLVCLLVRSLVGQLLRPLVQSFVLVLPSVQ